MSQDNNFNKASDYYNQDYFNWQRTVGEFGGWANSFKFKDSINHSDIVLDFGCGGGFLLNNLNCKRKIGVEPNDSAALSVKDFNITHYSSSLVALSAEKANSVDYIISNNALEHTANPLEELKNLKQILKKNGTIHFYVPCDSISYKYNPLDKNYHLFSWSPQNLGNLFVEAGFEVLYAKPYIHKWPPYYRYFGMLGWPIFNIICRIYGRIERSWFQVEIKAKKVT